MGKSICGVTMEDLVKAGLAIEEAKEFQRVLNEAVSGAERSDPRKVWREVVARRLLKPWHPHRLHQLIYYSVYADWDTSTNGPPPYWFPSQYQSKHTNLGRLMENHGSKLLGTSYKDPITSFSQFQKFSVQHPEAYWSIVLKELSVSFHEAPKCILDTTDKSKHGGTWLPGSALNIAECCLLPRSHPRKEDSDLAVVWRDEGSEDSHINHITLQELRQQVMYALTFIPNYKVLRHTRTQSANEIYLAHKRGYCLDLTEQNSFQMYSF